MATARAYPWCAFTLLFVLASLVSILAFPWPPPWSGVALGWAALAGLIGAGLFFGRDAGLGAPYLEAWCARRRVENRDWLRLAAALPHELAPALTVAQVKRPDGAFATGGSTIVYVLVPTAILPTVLAAVAGDGAVQLVHVPGSGR